MKIAARLPRFLATVALLSCAVTSIVLADGPAIRAVAMVKFRDDTPAKELAKILSESRRLATTHPGVIGYQAGVNVSPEGLNQGHTYGFIVDYKDRSARASYVESLEYQVHVENAAPWAEQVFVHEIELEKVPVPAKPGRVHHLVYFRYKPGTSPETIKRVSDEFGRLQYKIPNLFKYRAGVNVGSEELAQGYAHAFLMTFTNERARDDYLPHPDHQAFVALLLPALESALVLDFMVTPTDGSLFVTRGLEPYRVYQRDESGVADIGFEGTCAKDGEIEARVIAGRRLVSGFDWRPIGKAAKGTFTAELSDVPTGGEYTVEIRQRDRLGNVRSQTSVAHILVGDLWVLAGQSNMQGVGDLRDVEEPSDQVHCFTMAERWEPAVEPLHWLIDSPDPVHSGRYFKDGADRAARKAARGERRAQRTKGTGLGLPFAKELVARTGVPIGLIAAAHGGTSMEQWRPELQELNGTTLYGATLYGSMLKQARYAGGKIRGVLWYQGESDSGAETVPLFAERFKNLITAFRRDFSQPTLPFYFVQLGRFIIEQSDRGKGWNQIQELQRRANLEILNTAMVPVVDLPLDDLIHIGTDGLKRTGRRLARVAHRDLFGESRLKPGPQVGRIQISEDGREIRVSYTGVNGRLLPTDKVEGFSLHYGDGRRRSTIYRAMVDAAASDTVILKLSKPVDDDTYLHYGFGLNPTCNLVDTEDMAAPVFGPIKAANGSAGRTD